MMARVAVALAVLLLLATVLAAGEAAAAVLALSRRHRQVPTVQLMAAVAAGALMVAQEAMASQAQCASFGVRGARSRQRIQGTSK